MMSMFETVAKNQPNRSVSFIYSARNENLHPFDKDIRSLMEKWMMQNTVTLYSESGDGFITKDVLKEHTIARR